MTSCQCGPHEAAWHAKSSGAANRRSRRPPMPLCSLLYVGLSLSRQYQSKSFHKCFVLMLKLTSLWYRTGQHRFHLQRGMLARKPHLLA